MIAHYLSGCHQAAALQAWLVYAEICSHQQADCCSDEEFAKMNSCEYQLIQAMVIATTSLFHSIGVFDCHMLVILVILEVMTNVVVFEVG